MKLSQDHLAKNDVIYADFAPKENESHLVKKFLNKFKL